MKKLATLSVSSIALSLALLTSCGGGVSTKPSLKSENDSIAYSYGTQVYNSGLNQYIMQLGIVTDTTMFRYQLQQQIAMESDATKKEALEKKMKSQLDSVVTANKRNTAEFLRGLTEGIKANDSQANYLHGLTIGRQIGSQMLPGLEEQIFGTDSKTHLNKDVIASAVAVGLTNSKPAMENTDMFFNRKMEEMRAKLELSKNAELEKLKAEQDAIAEKFFAENAQKEGVITLPSGLQYKIINQGNGPIATEADQVQAHYHGTLLDGTVFDSSVDRGEPATFGVTGVIKGWTEALQLMPEGSKWMLYVPQDLAYGAREAGTIKPYSPLVFEVEVLKVIKSN